MGRQGVRLVVICEDAAHQQFARHVLLGIGFRRHELRVEVSTKGIGAADRFVLSEYPREMLGFRKRSAYQRVALLVCLDCDRRTGDDRIADLDQALVSEDVAPRRQEDRVAFWLPRRNIETWFAVLSGLADVDENTDYKYRVRNVDIKGWATQWIAQYRSSKHGDTPTLPSLKGPR